MWRHLHHLHQAFGEDHVRSILQDHSFGNTQNVPLKTMWQMPGAKSRLMDRLKTESADNYTELLKAIAPHENKAKRYARAFNWIAGLGAIGAIGSFILSLLDRPKSN
jgi:hypothetical protein